MPWLIGVLAALVVLGAVIFGGVGGMAAILVLLVLVAAGIVIKYLPPSRRARP